MKKEVFLLAIVFVGIVIISFNPQLTGSVVSELESEDIFIGELLTGEISKQSLEIEFEGPESLKQEVYVFGAVEDWIIMKEEYFYAIPGEVKVLDYYIQVPEGTRAGNYEVSLGLIVVNDFEDNSVLQDHVVQYINLEIEVIEEIIEGREINDFEVFDTDDYAYFSFEINNQGNQEIEEIFTIDVYDDEENFILREEYGVKAYASQNLEVKRKISEELENGKYFAILNDELVNKFEVVDSLKKEGEIVFSTTEVDNGDVKIINYFRNTGESVLSARMEGFLEEEFFSTEVKIYPDEIYVFGYETQLSGESNVYPLSLEIVSDNFVLAEVEEDVYNSNAIALEVNFYIIFVLVIALLVISHYLLVGRKKK
jgi:hypothetical protein